MTENQYGAHGPRELKKSELFDQNPSDPESEPAWQMCPCLTRFGAICLLPYQTSACTVLPVCSHSLASSGLPHIFLCLRFALSILSAKRVANPHLRLCPRVPSAVSPQPCPQSSVASPGRPRPGLRAGWGQGCGDPPRALTKSSAHRAPPEGRNEPEHFVPANSVHGEAGEGEEELHPTRSAPSWGASPFPEDESHRGVLRGLVPGKAWQSQHGWFWPPARFCKDATFTNWAHTLTGFCCLAAKCDINRSYEKINQIKEELSTAKINLETKVSRHIYSVHNNEICCVYKYTTYSFRNKHFRGSASRAE